MVVDQKKYHPMSVWGKIILKSKKIKAWSIIQFSGQLTFYKSGIFDWIRQILNQSDILKGWIKSREEKVRKTIVLVDGVLCLKDIA